MIGGPQVTSIISQNPKTFEFAVPRRLHASEGTPVNREGNNTFLLSKVDTQARSEDTAMKRVTHNDL